MKSKSDLPEGGAPFEIQFISLFPEVFESVLSVSLLGKAVSKGLLRYGVTQIRDHATDRHRTVDDTPYGGGVGMLLRADVLYSAWKAALGSSLPREPGVRTVLLSPQGKLFTQSLAKEWMSSTRKLILVCGHYEGVDERFIEECVDEEVSIGDYVLTGGELPAAVIADVCARLVPGIVGRSASVEEDSLEGGLLKYPQYTRPRDFHGRSVPDVLMSGNHGDIEAWRRRQREERTARKRPDLWAQVADKKDSKALK